MHLSRLTINQPSQRYGVAGDSPFTAIPSENEGIANDALYRLTNSTGREHINQPGTEYNDFPSGIVLPHPNDPQAMRRYSRAYAYDNSGNKIKRTIYLDGYEAYHGFVTAL